MRKTIFTLTGLCIILLGCYDDDKETLYPTGVCDTSGVTYSGFVQPLLVQSCAYTGCHAGAAPAGGIDLSRYADVRAAALNGKLSGVVNHKTGFSPMPKNGTKLPACTIEKIDAWITKGALNN